MRPQILLAFAASLMSAKPEQAKPELNTRVLFWPEEDPVEKPADNSIYAGPAEPRAATEDDDCECVWHYQCRNGTYNVDGVDLLDIRTNVACEHLEHVCCMTHAITKKETSPAPTSRGCGYRNFDGVGHRNFDVMVGPRIFEDFNTDTMFGEFPWTGMIFRKEGQHSVLYTYHGGCSLIHPRVAITAAHKVAARKKHPELLKVRFGDWDVGDTDELLPHQERVVQKVVVHQQFSSGSGAYNIALLFLDRPLERAGNVNFICLPQPGLAMDSGKCMATGWGAEAFKGREQVMKRAQVKVVSHSKCQDALRVKKGSHFKLHDSFMCAGDPDEGKDTCTGDGGSPLMCPMKGQLDRYYQVGIVAWGIGCGARGFPGVYTYVLPFVQWIENALRDNGISEFYHRP